MSASLQIISSQAQIRSSLGADKKWHREGNQLNDKNEWITQREEEMCQKENQKVTKIPK